MGERICAFVTQRQPAAAPLDLAEVRGFLEGRGVARFKWPERLELLDPLPVTSVGKIDKQQLRRRAAELAGG